ncbi:MAG: hypothetical protein D6732_01695 [Methanobacteriota archaeon]|nr:MAG: hypothetical protein D6732_01695 [Euryarchaeota archaeon]
MALKKTNPTGKEEYKKALQAFQASRIRDTYADLASDPQYALLIDFFFEHIYGPQDFSFRNQSIKTLHKRLSGFLKGEIIEEVGRVIQLQELSDQLDELMAEKSLELEIKLPFTMESYSQVYRYCNNYSQRVHQIELLIEATRGIHRLSQMPFIGWSLKIVRKAAQIAGFGEIMDFLISGYQAFHSTKDIEPFLKIVEKREKALNDQLFGK